MTPSEIASRLSEAQDDEIARDLAQALYSDEDMAEMSPWVEEPGENFDPRSFGIDGHIDLVSIVAFVRRAILEEQKDA